MPCYDPREDDERMAGREALMKVDELTDLLCKAGQAYLYREKPPTELLSWWAKHRTWDELRGEPWPVGEPWIALGLVGLCGLIAVFAGWIVRLLT